MSKYKKSVLLTQILLVIMFLSIWELGARTGLVNTFIFSSPGDIVKTLLSLIQSGEFFKHIFVTFKEVLISFSLGLLIAFLVSVIMYLNKFIASVIDPFLTLLNSLPKVALGPIIIIWCGANQKSIIVMALLINVFISIITIYHGFVGTDSLRLKLFSSYRASKMQILTKLVIPSNISTIISALKINISLTFIGVIMGEFLVSKRGIGYWILYGTQVFNLNLVITGIFVLIVMSYLIYEIITYIEKKLLF